MKTKKPFIRPEGYNYPYFTGLMLSEILGVNPLTINKKKEMFATEVTPGCFMWSDDDVKKMLEAPISPGNPNFKKKKKDLSK